MHAGHKHAYLIMAHHEFEILEDFLKLLDSEFNDFYIHIDKKAKDFAFDKFQSICRHSNVIFLKKRINANWGGYSLIKCELALLRECYQKGYSYVHLCSGADLPIKHKDYIYNFFESNRREYVELLTQEGYAFERLKYLNLFNDSVYKNHKLAIHLNYILDRVQRRLRIYRKVSERKVVKLAQWFSLTGEAADYLYENRKRIKRLFKHSVCGDELFVGTILFGTPFWTNIHSKESHTRANMRFMKWTADRRSADVLTIDDFEEMKNGPCLFGRKFSYEVDGQVIEEIKKEINSYGLSQ